MKGNKSKAGAAIVAERQVLPDNRTVELSFLLEKSKDKQWLREQYQRDSLMVHEESMNVLREFEQLDDEATAV